MVSQRDKQLASVQKESEGEHRRAENGVERIRALVDENAELRRRLSVKHNEVHMRLRIINTVTSVCVLMQVGAASEDLLLLTKENQSLTSTPTCLYSPALTTPPF